MSILNFHFDYLHPSLTMCAFRCPAWPNDFLHSEQVWLITSLWMIICVSGLAAWPKDLLHWTQLCALSLHLCIFRLCARPNNSLHSEQVCVCEWACAFSKLQLDQMTSGLGHNCKTRFVVFGDQNWGDLGGLHSNKSRPELTVSRLTARNAIRVATRIVMFLVWPRPELSCVVTRNKTLSSYRNYIYGISSGGKWQKVWKGWSVSKKWLLHRSMPTHW